MEPGPKTRASSLLVVLFAALCSTANADVLNDLRAKSIRSAAGVDFCMTQSLTDPGPSFCWDESETTYYLDPNAQWTGKLRVLANGTYLGTGTTDSFLTFMTSNADNYYFEANDLFGNFTLHGPGPVLFKNAGGARYYLVNQWTGALSLGYGTQTNSAIVWFMAGDNTPSISVNALADGSFSQMAFDSGLTADTSRFMFKAGSDDGDIGLFLDSRTGDMTVGDGSVTRSWTFTVDQDFSEGNADPSFSWNKDEESWVFETDVNSSGALRTSVGEEICAGGMTDVEDGSVCISPDDFSASASTQLAPLQDGAVVFGTEKSDAARVYLGPERQTGTVEDRLLLIPDFNTTNGVDDVCTVRCREQPEAIVHDAITTPPQALCDANNRMEIRGFKGLSGDEDKVYICLKGGDDIYRWISWAIGGHG